MWEPVNEGFPLLKKSNIFRFILFLTVCSPFFRPQVRERDLPMVMHTLSSEFTLLRVVNGETVAAHNLGVTNGFVKPKLGRKNKQLHNSVCVFVWKTHDMQEV